LLSANPLHIGNITAPVQFGALQRSVLSLLCFIFGIFTQPNGTLLLVLAFGLSPALIGFLLRQFTPTIVTKGPGFGTLYGATSFLVLTFALTPPLTALAVHLHTLPIVANFSLSHDYQV
jgi:hypothetical protein